MECPGCGTQLSSSDQFCPGCGAKIIRKKRCPECGESVREGTRFCPSCGAEMAGAVKKANPAPPKKKAVRKETPSRRRDWEEEDWEDDDDEEESVDALTIMTVIVGCILLVIVAVLGFNLFQRYVPKNYERASQEQEEQEEEDEGEEEENEGDGQQLEEQSYGDGESLEASDGGTLVTTTEVNIRDNPSKQGTNVIKKAKKGESYTYTEAVEGGTWYRILLSDDGGDYGYVFGEYVEVQ